MAVITIIYGGCWHNNNPSLNWHNVVYVYCANFFNQFNQNNAESIYVTVQVANTKSLL